MNDLHPLFERLAGMAHAGGGWGYAPGQAAHLEPTCLALLALAQQRDKYQPAIDPGLAALRRTATEDGFYRLAQGREEAVWPTALVLFVQSTLGCPPDEVAKTAGRLLAFHGRPHDSKEAAEYHDIDLKLIGWPWAEGNFSWVEPTAWAILALRKVGQGKHARVEEGIRLLLDRASDKGGINYGNRRILGKVTDPIPGPTAMMLLALQGHSAEPRVAAAVAYLQQGAPLGNDVEHLCWAKIALDAHREVPGVSATLASLDQRILASREVRATTPWVQPAPLREALTILALASPEWSPLRLDGVVDAPPLAPSYAFPSRPAPAKRKPLGDRIRAAFRGLAVDAVGRMRPLPTHSDVHIAKASDYAADLASIVGKQYAAFRDKVPLKGKRVVLKPNLVEYHRDKVINTHPNVIAAAIELCQREGAAEVIVAEGPGHWRNAEYLVSASGLGDVLRHYNVRFVDLNHDEPVKMANMGRLTGLEYLYIARTVATAEVLISMPKLKTHHWAGATLSLKNLFGTLPGICYGWPKNELHWRGIDNSIVDIALTRPPDLAIVDGIIGMEGDGPLNGTPKPMGVLVMGTDPLATDATCCRLMQLEPERIASLAMAAQKKLGLLREGEIRQIGEAIASLAQPFDTVPHFREIKFSRSA